MENLVFGIISMALCVSFFVAALKKYRSNQYRLALLFIMLAGIVLRLFVASDLYLHEWDERYHALVAKNLTDNPFVPMLYKTPLLEYDYRDWASNHIWVHKQPVPLYSMALSMWLFGKNVIALRIPSILLSTLTIFYTYRIGEMLFSRRAGMLAASLCAIHGLLLELTAGRVATDHIDVFFMAFITMAIYWALRFSREGRLYMNVCCAVFTAGAILTKWLPALIVWPLWLVALRHERGKIDRHIAVQAVIWLLTVVILVLPWQMYIHSRFPVEAAWESKYNWKHIFEPIGPHGHPFYYYFDQMRMLFGELIYLPALWLVYIAIRKKDRYRYLILLLWIAIPYVFFSLVKTKMQGYIMFAAPAIFILTGVFVVFLMVNRRKFTYPKGAVLAASLLLALPLRYSIERIKPFEMKPRTEAWIDKMKSLASGAPGSQKVIFNCRYPVETMFYTDMVAYETLPPKAKLEELNQNGYTIYIDNAFDIPDDMKDIAFARYESITGGIER
ncbi:MAG: glycosyltransferase family 39 protein [Lewinellaceae bacterium]|nr:glycosyltransferase family 39 protein [Lewinellaceae bacterium]